MNVAAMVAVLSNVAPPTTVPPDPLGAVGQNADQVREQACKIVSVSSRTCTPSTPSPPKPPPTFDLSWLSWIMWMLLIVGLAWVLFVVLRSLVRRPPGRRIRRGRKARGQPDVDEIELDRVTIDRSREPIDWRAEAESHRQGGRYRDAVRCRYRALVGDLARRGLIDEIPGRTTGEERSQLQQVQPAAGVPFAAAADLFDDAWYGHAEVGVADDDRLQHLEHDVLARTTESR